MGTVPLTTYRDGIRYNVGAIGTYANYVGRYGTYHRTGPTPYLKGKLQVPTVYNQFNRTKSIRNPVLTPDSDEEIFNF